MKVDKTQLTFLNQLASEIIVLDKDLRIVWLNDSALNKGWALNSNNKDNFITDQFSEETNAKLVNLLSKVINKNGAKTKRDFELSTSANTKRIVDLTVSWSRDFECLILEILCVDNLNKIIDSTKTFSTQKIAANLARTLAHEVKNPLGGIRGAAQLLARELESPTLREYTDVIMEEVDRLRALVDRLLGPRERLHPRLMNIHEVLERVKQLIEVESEGAVSVVRNYDPSLPEFNADPDQITQIILNISRNAVQALQGQGGITFKTRAKRQYTLGGQRHKLVCAVDIIDPGPGIPPDILPQLFLPMVSSRAKGAGLGLAIAQMIANRHGGLIQCQSEPGNTCFTLLLPMEG